jgi:DNA-binding MarR family transcriptional regulator
MTKVTALRVVPGLASEGKEASAAEPAINTEINTEFLEQLIGYNARRAALSIIAVFLDRMAVYGLRPVDFSVLTVIHDNPGLTSRQLCDALNLLPPNLVGIVAALEKRGLLKRTQHPRDKRALGLSLTAAGRKLTRQAMTTARDLEGDLAQDLTLHERETLIRLLQRIYKV